MLFNKIITELANALILHWNARDMRRLASCLASNVVVKSPYIKKLFPANEESILQGKEAVMEYWRVLNRDYFFEMKYIDLKRRKDSLYCLVDIGSDEIQLHVVFRMNEYGKFSYMEMEYK